MYHARSALPQLLSAADYFSPASHAREIEAVFERSWQLVAMVSEVPRPGDFVTTEVAGRPVIVRNEAGTHRTYLNVCAHRRCLLTSDSRGNAAKLKCQYHGWEYDADGATAKIPDAKQFAPLDRDGLRLRTLRTELCGQLIFAVWSESGPSLREQFADVYDFCEQRFGDSRPITLQFTRDHQANWKVPVENALESYHVPHIHAATFKDDPGENRSVHRMTAANTEFVTRLPFSAHSKLDAWTQRFESWIVRALRRAPTGDYRHLHIFPNLLFSFTDALSLCQTFTPLTPTTCRAVYRQFGLDRRGLAWPQLAAANVWDHAVAWVSARISREDQRLYPHVQRGLEASVHAGTLGRCEERLHAFQHWVQSQCRGVPSDSNCEFPATNLELDRARNSECGTCPAPLVRDSSR